MISSDAAPARAWRGQVHFCLGDLAPSTASFKKKARPPNGGRSPGKGVMLPSPHAGLDCAPLLYCCTAGTTTCPSLSTCTWRAWSGTTT